MICAYCGAVSCPDEAEPGSGPQVYCDDVCKRGAKRKRARAHGTPNPNRRQRRERKTHARSCTRKRRFRTREAAEQSRVDAPWRKAPGDVYPCLSCGFWHITSNTVEPRMLAAWARRAPRRERLP